MWIILYNLFGHPLRNVPGPKLYAVSDLPQTWRANFLGLHFRDLTEMHEKYGDVVRVGPNEVSCVSVQSWKTIHGFGDYFLRDPQLTALFPASADNLGSPNRQSHRLFRNLIAPVFSDRALAAQEPEIVSWADKLVAALKERSSKPIDIALAVEWAASDVMGDLMLGRSFDCLENWESPKWMRLIHAGSETLSICQVFLRFEVLALFYGQVLRLPVVQRWMEGLNLTSERTKARIDSGASTKRDAVTLMWEENKTGVDISQSSIEGVSSLLFLAGSETTTTALSGIIWLLLTTPEAYERFTEELRSLADEELTPRTLASLTYLNCTIQEGLRLHSPGALTVKRMVPVGGTTIDGHFVPAGVSSPF